MKLAQTALMLSCLTAHAGEPAYTVHDLGAIGIEAEAHAINNSGVIVGLSYDTIAAHLSVRFEDPSPVPLLIPSALQQMQAVGITDAGFIATMAFSLNDLGADAVITADGLPPIDIAGFIPRGIDAQGRLVGARPVLTVDNMYTERAAWWDGAARIDLPALAGSAWSIAHDIDPAGRIIGSAIPQGAMRPRAVLWDGAAIDLGTLGGATAQALAINGNSEIVGVAETASGKPHAFLFRVNGQSVSERLDLGFLGGNASAAYDINDNGQVVGASFGHAFLWEQGAMLDLNEALVDPDGWVLETATAINAAGTIVGHGVHAPYGRRAFVLVPVAACTADLNGDGILDLGDIQAFVVAFVAGDPLADLAAPFGVLDLADISVFVGAFVAGCG